MTNLISNKLFDMAFPNERQNCTEPIKEKRLEKDVKQIFFLEKIIDYRCYFNREKQCIYYIAETKDNFLAFKQDLITRKNVKLQTGKEELL